MINNNPSSIESKKESNFAERSLVKPASKIEQSAEIDPVTEIQKIPANTEVRREREQPAQEALEAAIKESLAEVIPKVREMMQKNQRSLDFKVAEQENRVIITVIDKETEKVIRQIPPEDVLHIAEKMGQGLDDALMGVLIDSYA